MTDLNKLLKEYSKEQKDLLTCMKLSTIPSDFVRKEELEKLISAIGDILSTEEEMNDAENYCGDLEEALSHINASEDPEGYGEADYEYSEAYNEFVRLEGCNSGAWDEYKEIEE